jgi:hypothetical protein
MENKKTCANCRRDLDIGTDTLRVEEGVIGTRGSFVPLDKTLYFCCDRCLKDYYDMSDLPNMPKRIP